MEEYYFYILTYLVLFKLEIFLQMRATQIGNSGAKIQKSKGSQALTE